MPSVPTSSSSGSGHRSFSDAAATTAAQEEYWPEPPDSQQQQQQQGPGAASVTTAVADQQQQQPQQGALQPQQYSPLHYDIQKFVKRIVPTDQEMAEKQRIIQAIAVATRRSFDDTSGIRLQPFGSFVNGLSTWNSDIDLVVTGIVQPSSLTGGFEPGDKRLVSTALERIAGQLRRYRKIPIKKMIIIRTARIPIIKLETTTRVTADISLGDGSGPKAARYVAQQVAQYPPLAPLTLVIKVFLRSCGLNEVANGGLSSFSITNMVLAHILQELQEGRDVYDLGEALYGFLLRFGEEFDVRQDAVSVAMGGCVPRSDLSHLADSGPRERLLLEDPLTGRDVATGSYRIAAVQAAFRRAARHLEQLASAHHSSSSSSTVSNGGSSSGRVNYLEGLFNVQRVLSRDGKGFSGSGRGGGRGLGLADGGGVVAEEYFVLGRGGGYTDFDEFGGYTSDSQVDLPLEGDDYDDELEALLSLDGGEGGHSSGRDEGRGRRGRRRHRS